MTANRAARRHSRWAATLALTVALTGCGHPDPIEILKQDKPHDARASTACAKYQHAPSGQVELLAAKDATVGDLRPHMQKVMGSSISGQQELDTLSSKPDDQYAALCLLQYSPSALQETHLPADLGPLTLALLDDGESFWVDPGPGS